MLDEATNRTIIRQILADQATSGMVALVAQAEIDAAREEPVPSTYDVHCANRRQLLLN